MKEIQYLIEQRNSALDSVVQALAQRDQVAETLDTLIKSLKELYPKMTKKDQLLLLQRFPKLGE